MSNGLCVQSGPTCLDPNLILEALIHAQAFLKIGSGFRLRAVMTRDFAQFEKAIGDPWQKAYIAAYCKLLLRQIEGMVEISSFRVNRCQCLSSPDKIRFITENTIRLHHTF